ncbi:MAG: OmpH family outer membrane protein [Prevotellaceae bacterium]|nr:OmpH family outer membrane protein [Prevotella sp.]MDD5876108.1 OmpH family outer membrane protein [Prevotellaceae bacterium]MDD7421679.1 OmpH family outer membrane protein [Prevotellaceae bacterium]MDY5947363.1 OmpH family outer membrane protein [Prevotella sp.]
MNKKNVYASLAVAAMTVVAMTSCDKSKSQVDEQAAGSKVAPTETKIAFVEVDSIMTQYKFCKEYSLILQKKGQNIQNTLAQKQQQLEAAAANFQQKVQQNAYTREQAQGIQAQLQRQSADLQALNQRLSGEFQNETEKYNNALRDSIKHFLTSYNKDKKYSLILSKAGDNILYADKAHDITNEVIAGLNKAYKSSPALKDAGKEKK